MTDRKLLLPEALLETIAGVMQHGNSAFTLFHLTFSLMKK
jgi:hypothetical protein